LVGLVYDIQRHIQQKVPKAQQRRGTQPDEQPKCRERQHIVAGLQPLTTESVVKIRYFVHSSSVIVFSTSKIIVL
jgi:hypothetical protein